MALGLFGAPSEVLSRLYTECYTGEITEYYGANKKQSNAAILLYHTPETGADGRWFIYTADGLYMQDQDHNEEPDGLVTRYFYEEDRDAIESICMTHPKPEEGSAAHHFWVAQIVEELDKKGLVRISAGAI